MAFLRESESVLRLVAVAVGVEVGECSIVLL